MSQNKQRKMDLGAACSSGDGDEPHIAQQTAIANCTAGSGSTNENGEKTIFMADISEFREAVKWSGFVDRSLLIEELLSKKTNAKNVIIFAPKRFGKSMNVSTVKRYFEIEGGRDVINAPQDLTELENFENFKAFNRYDMKQPCKILAKEDLVKEHFGRHPVLHLTFKDVDASSIQNVEYRVKELIHKAYLAHSYLKDGEIFSLPRDNEDANEHCRIWCHPKEYKEEEAIGGLEQLIQYLHAYHKRKVYLLVDELDAPAVDALLAGKNGDEVKNISNKITKLLGAVVKGEVADRYLLGSLITGVSYLGSVGISENLDNVPVYKWLLDDGGRFAPYYGLSHDELTTLLQQVFPNDKEKRISIQNEVNELYNGYNFKGDPLYCLWSVLHYIHNRSTLDTLKITNTSFWGGSCIIAKLGSLLKNNVFMEEVMQIMDISGDGYISFEPCNKVDVQVLVNFLSKKESNIEFDVVLSFFMEQGYFTRVLDQRENVRPRNKEIRVKIPNTDVLVGFQEMFQNYVIEICGLSDRLMSKCAGKIERFLHHLRPLLRKFNGQKGINERSLQAALYTTMLKTGFKECCLDKYVKIDSRIGKIDQLIIFPEGH